MVRFALTIFLSAFLLFQVQPLIGKYILPWFGGTPAVWTTCVLFFQLMLLGGYSYAHLLGSRLSPRQQAGVHLSVLAASLVFLQFFPPSETWKPAGDEPPTLNILLLLGATIGFPYLVLSATGPLLQEWFHRSQPTRSPYRLYALSNVGSLLALLTYPFVIEPNLRLGMQATVWSMGYGLFATCCAWCAARLIWPARREASAPPTSAIAAEDTAPPDLQNDSCRPSAGDVVMWLLLSACGSAMLLATTNQMCQEVAVVPFLWVLPLAIYLISFIICFDNPLWYAQGVFTGLLGISVFVGALMLHLGGGVYLWIQVVVCSIVLFAVCMSCHGELVNSRPHPRHLTLFYLMISGGGALGGLFVALLAPILFLGFWEYHAAMAASCLIVLVAMLRDRRSIAHRDHRLLVRWAFAGSWVILVLALLAEIHRSTDEAIKVARNFYGVLKVSEPRASVDTVDHRYKLTHGRTQHGFQFRNPERRNWPTSYYGHGSGVGIAVARHPRRRASDARERGLKIGVVGLGTGTMAALLREGDFLRFYEINPKVVEFAGVKGQYFTFLRDSPGRSEVILGDARVQLEREIARGDLQQFDLLVIDAFSSDAVPMHLLTCECSAIYWKHLKPDGILAIHVSNHHLDLKPVVRGLAMECGRQAVMIESQPDRDLGLYDPQWILLTGNQQFLSDPMVIAKISPWAEGSPTPVFWTDDYGSLWQVLNVKPDMAWTP